MPQIAGPFAKLPDVETFSAPPGYDDTADHIANFFRAVETREHVVEDEVFGNNTAIACHMGNHSYFQSKCGHVGRGCSKYQGLAQALRRP